MRCALAGVFAFLSSSTDFARIYSRIGERSTSRRCIRWALIGRKHCNRIMQVKRAEATRAAIKQSRLNGKSEDRAQRSTSSNILFKGLSKAPRFNRQRGRPSAALIANRQSAQIRVSIGSADISTDSVLTIRHTRRAPMTTMAWEQIIFRLTYSNYPENARVCRCTCGAGVAIASAVRSGEAQQHQLRRFRFHCVKMMLQLRAAFRRRATRAQVAGTWKTYVNVKRVKSDCDCDT